MYAFVPVKIVDNQFVVSELLVDVGTGLTVEEGFVHDGERMAHASQFLGDIDVLLNVGCVSHSSNIFVAFQLFGVRVLHSCKYKRQCVHLCYVVAEGGVGGLVANGNDDVDFPFCIFFRNNLSRLHYFVFRVPVFAIEVSECDVGIHLIIFQVVEYGFGVVGEVVSSLAFREHHEDVFPWL